MKIKAPLSLPVLGRHQTLVINFQEPCSPAGNAMPTERRSWGSQDTHGLTEGMDPVPSCLLRQLLLSSTGATLKVSNVGHLQICFNR